MALRRIDMKLFARFGGGDAGISSKARLGMLGMLGMLGGWSQAREKDFLSVTSDPTPSPRDFLGLGHMYPAKATRLRQEMISVRSHLLSAAALFQPIQSAAPFLNNNLNNTCPVHHIKAQSTKHKAQSTKHEVATMDRLVASEYYYCAL